jgi:hypothetical protein
MSEADKIIDDAQAKWDGPEDLAARLAAIDNLIERDKATKEAAKTHGISVAAIKAEIARRKKRPTVVEFPAELDAEKLAAAPSLDETLSNVSAFMGRFICYPSENARIAHTLWVAHCHLMEAWYTTPRLAFMSAEKASGKTRALEVTELLVPRPKLSFSISAAALVRIIAKGHEDGTAPTVLFDEIDNLFARGEEGIAELRGALNSGYRRGATATRCVNHGADVIDFPCFGALAVAGLKALPDTLASRSIFIRMRRRAPGEKVEQFRLRQISPQAQVLFDALALRCREIERAMATAEPKMPGSITDRDAECWEPLFAVADAAGGDWPKVARDAAVGLIAGAVDDIQSDGVELLEHVREAMGGEDKIWTLTLLNRLHNMDESPWMDIKGRPLTDRGLAERLKPYGIKSKDVRIGDKHLKGYYASDLYEAWNIYLAPPVRDKGDKRDNFDNKNNFVADVTDVAHGEPKEAAQETTMTDADNDPFDSLKDESLVPDLPAFLDRRKNPHSSPLSEPGTKVPYEVTMKILRGERG